MSWRILVVEDEDDIREQIVDLLSGSVPAVDDIPPEIHATGSFDEALHLLESERFDVVVLDIRDQRVVDGSPTDDADSGLDVFRQVRSRIFVPIVFYTALPELASDCGAPPFVQVVSKNTDDEVDALREAVNRALHSTFQQLRARFDEHIEHVKRDFMIDFVEQHWDELHQEQRRSDVAHLLVRRLAASLEGGASLFADLLEGTEPAEVDALVHPMRYYIVPPLDDRRTGDVLVFHEVDADGEPTEEWYVVLTPSCDFVPTRLKADHTVMVACDLLEDTKEYKEWSEAGDDAKESARKKVESIMRNNRVKSQSERFHFLPAAWDVPNLVVDFQRWRHITTATLDGAERVATIDSPFVEALVSRFTRYFNRVGTPDLDVNVAIDRLT